MSENYSQSYYQRLEDLKITKYWNKERYNTLSKLLEVCKVGPGLAGQDASIIMIRCVFESHSKDDAQKKIDKVIEELRELSNYLQNTPMVGVLNKEQKPYQNKKKPTKEQRVASDKVSASLRAFFGPQIPVQSSENAVMVISAPNSDPPPVDELDAYINFDATGNDNDMNEVDEGSLFEPQEHLDPKLVALLETDGVHYAQTPQGGQAKLTVIGNRWTYSIKQ